MNSKFTLVVIYMFTCICTEHAQSTTVQHIIAESEKHNGIPYQKLNEALDTVIVVDDIPVEENILISSAIEIPSTTPTIKLKKLNLHRTTLAFKPLTSNNHVFFLGEQSLEEPENYIIVDKEKYYLYQFHLHIPSDHTIDKQLFNAELHIIYKNSVGRYAVTGVLFKIGDQPSHSAKFVFDSLLDTIKNIRAQAATGKTEPIYMYDITSLFPESWNYRNIAENQELYSYIGTTTMAPIINNVAWFVFKTPFIISKDQLEQLRNLNVAALR